MPPTAPRPAARAVVSTRWFRRSLIALASTLVSLAAAELVHRLWQSSRGRAFDSSEVLARIRSDARVTDTAEPKAASTPRDGENIVLNPFFGSEYASLHDVHDIVGSFTREPVSSHARVLVFGGSVATFFVRDIRESAAARLSKDPRLGGRAVELFNCAHDAYKQPQQLNKLAYLLARGIRPDLVIELDGFNELALARCNWLNETDPLYPTDGMWSLRVQDLSFEASDFDRIGAAWSLRQDARSLARCAERWGLYRSSIASTWLLARIHANNAAIHELETAAASTPELARDSAAWHQVHGYDVPSTADEMVALSLRAWEECSVSMAALCRARDVAYLHVIQPTLFDLGSKPLTPREQATADTLQPWRPPIVRHYATLRERSKRLAERGVTVLDASYVFKDVSEELYYDQCHFHARGNELLWEFIEAQCVELLMRTKR